MRNFGESCSCSSFFLNLTSAARGCTRQEELRSCGEVYDGRNVLWWWRKVFNPSFHSPYPLDFAHRRPFDCTAARKPTVVQISAKPRRTTLASCVAPGPYDWDAASLIFLVGLMKTVRIRRQWSIDTPFALWRSSCKPLPIFVVLEP